jgi:hypothetical protein
MTDEPTLRHGEILRIEDFSDADIEAVRQSEPSPDSEAFNDELEQERVTFPGPVPG